MKRTLMILGFIASALTALNGCQANCDEWYEADGLKCIEMREKFYGTYVGTATTDGQTQNWSAQLSAHNEIDKVVLNGTNYIQLTGSTSFSIPLQNVYDQNGTYQIEGSGSVNGNQLILNYVATFQGSTSVINFTGTK
ncbi:MAG: hypothetical protein K9G41_12335 [Flavobacteriales bacterium]|nr:hypothetical protein [Flavobacteriales bacterium]